MRLPLLAALCLFAGALSATPVKAPSNADCLTCHADPSATRADGRSVSVSEGKFAASVHGAAGLGCVDCHTDLGKTSDFPHKERLAPVVCASCHDGAGAAHPFHPAIGRATAIGGQGKAEVPCAACHGSHEIVPVKDAALCQLQNCRLSLLSEPAALVSRQEFRLLQDS